MYHKQHVGEPRAEVDPVNVVMAGGLGSVDVTALGTVELHHRLTRDVRETYPFKRRKKITH